MSTAEQVVVVPENLDGSGAVGHATVDAQHPWPGGDAYDESSGGYFRGRAREAAELLRLIRLAPLTVLYSKSGLGKTSLLQAGLFPLLRAQHYLPVPLRLDFSQAMRIAPLEQVKERLITSLQRANAEFPAPRPDEDVWEYLHRKDAEFWSTDNFPLTPVLVFDQFEELFSRTGGNQELIRQVFIDLAELIENRIPAALATEAARPRRSRLDLLSQHYCVLLSFREDFLPDVRTWEKHVPSLLRNYLRLEPMTRACAIEAVQQSGKAVLEPGVAASIVDLVGKSDQQTSETLPEEMAIEPVLLSLCCTQLNLRRLEEARKNELPPETALINQALVDKAGQDILESFYRGALENPDVKGEPSVALFIETYLIQGEHFRGDYPKQEALHEGKITARQLSALTDRIRLLRIVHRSDTARIELIHDRLVPVVRKARDQRKEQAAREEERRQKEMAEAEADRQRAYNEQLRRERDRARRNLRSAIAVSVVALLTFVWAGLAWYVERQVKTATAVGWSMERLADARLALGPREPLEEMGYRALATYRLSRSNVHLSDAEPATLSVLETVLDKYAHLLRIVRIPGLMPTPALTFSPDGKILAVGGEDGLLRLIDANDYHVLDVLDCQPRKSESVWAVAFNSDSSRVAAGYSRFGDDAGKGEGLVCVFDLKRHTAARWASTEHGGPPSDVFSVAYGSRAGAGFVLFGGSDKKLRKWDPDSGNPVEIPSPQTGEVIAVAISSDGQRAAVGGEGGALNVWNVDDLGDPSKTPVTLTGHVADIQQIAFSPASPERLISAGDDGRVMAWNVDGPCWTERSKLQPARIYTVAIAGNGKLLAAGGADGYVRLFSLLKATQPCTPSDAAATSTTVDARPEFDVIPEGVLSGHSGTILGVAFNPRAQQLASVAQDGSIRFWIPNSGSFSRAQLQLESSSSAGVTSGTVTAVGVTPDAQAIVAGDSNGNLFLWGRPSDNGTPETLTPAESWRAHDKPIRSLAFVKLGAQTALISGGDDGVLKRWNITSGAMIGGPMTDSAKAITAISVMPDGNTVAAGSVDGTIRIWDPVTAQLKTRIPAPEGSGADYQLATVGFTSEGKYLAVGSNYQGIRVVDLTDAHHQEHTLRGQTMGVTSIAQDRRAWLLSSGVDGSVVEWDAAALQRPQSAGLRDTEDFHYRMGSAGARNLQAITAMGVTANGNLILTGGHDGQVALWDGTRHVLISDQFQGHSTQIVAVATAPDGSYFVTADAYKILMWPGPERWPDILCSKLNANMSRKRWKELVSSDIDYSKQCPALPIEPDESSKAAQ